MVVEFFICVFKDQSLLQLVMVFFSNCRCYQRDFITSVSHSKNILFKQDQSLKTLIGSIQEPLKNQKSFASTLIAVP